MRLSRHGWILFFGLAACAPAQWEKPGASADTARADSDACRSTARLQSPPPFATNPPSATIATPTLNREEQLASYENEQFQKCMRAKGYTASR